MPLNAIHNIENKQTIGWRALLFLFALVLACYTIMPDYPTQTFDLMELAEDGESDSEEEEKEKEGKEEYNLMVATNLDLSSADEALTYIVFNDACLGIGTDIPTPPPERA